MSNDSLSFLYLSEPDLVRVGVKECSLCVDTCEEVFRLVSSGDYIMGGAKHNEHGSVISFPEHPVFSGMPADGPERRFIAMPSYVGGSFRTCGVKWYGSNIENKEKGLPRSILTLELNDPETGAPLSFMSANLISAMRTGCVPGVAVRHLLPQTPHTCSLVGCEPVNRASLSAVASQVDSLEKVYVEAAHRESAQRCCDWIASTLGLDAEPLDSLDDACAKGDIVIIGASPTYPLRLSKGCVHDGSLVILNSPVEADDGFWTASDLVFDNPKMHDRYMEEAERELGDVELAVNGFGKLYGLMRRGGLKTPDELGGLGDWCSGKAFDHQNEYTTLVTSGQAILDVAYGTVLYRRALEQGVGVELELWNKPEWI